MYSVGRRYLCGGGEDMGYVGSEYLYYDLLSYLEGVQIQKI